ncbi:unnamed protein product [Closterium sp. NIES-54]
MSRAFLLLVTLSAVLAAVAGVAAATGPPRSGGIALRGGDGSVTGGAATTGVRGGSGDSRSVSHGDSHAVSHGDSHDVSHGDSQHRGIPGGGSDEEREEDDEGHGGHGGRGHDNHEADSANEGEDDSENGDDDEDDSEHGGGGSSHGGGLCGRGGCSNDSGEVGYWKLPDYGRCSIGTGSSGGAPRKADEAWCAGAAVGVKECCSRCSSTNVTVDGTPFNCRHWAHIPSPGSHDRGSSEQRGKCVLLPAVDALTPEKARKGRCGTNTGGDTVRVGRRCAYGENDPHFLGAHGTRFDFNGLPRRSFCLYTDRRVHVNMAMRGYLDHRPLAPSAGNRGTMAAARFVAVSQTPEDAQVHINLMFVDSNPSSEVHGVMGQTYRSGREQRTMEYSKLAALLHHPVSVDGEEGKGFLDGEVGDYETSAVTATDCRFTAFNGGQLPLLAE